MMSATLEPEALSATDAYQFLTFQLGGQEYGLEILMVQEIKGLSAITRIPNTPPHLKGVTNLRGAVVPIIDLRLRFGIEERPYDHFTVFIIATVGSRVVGLVVDAVEDVIDLPPEAIQPVPELTAQLGGAYVRGIAHVQERLIALLDIPRIVEGDLEAVPAS